MDFDQRADDFRMSWLHDDEEEITYPPAIDLSEEIAAGQRMIEAEAEIVRRVNGYRPPFVWPGDSAPAEIAGERFCVRCAGTGNLTDTYPGFGYGSPSLVRCMDCDGHGVRA